MSTEHVAKLGRSSLLNPSCPPVSSDAEHAKKHELVRAQLADRAKRKRELTNYARLKKLAKVALARKLAVILHRMWINETNFRWTIREPAPAAAI